jgi:HK97 family phage prohead protease
MYKRSLAELEYAASDPWASLETQLEYAIALDDDFRRQYEEFKANQLITKKATTTIIRKTYAKRAFSDNALDFVLSDATPDRYDDTIDPNGWELTNFKKNPIALFNHQSSFPIGRWQNLAVRDKALRGHLHLAAAGTSPRIDELRALVDSNILRSVSVGFIAIESRPRNEGRGMHYVKQELVETSLVSVPANPNAVMTAKQLGVSGDTLAMVFGRDIQPNVDVDDVLEVLASEAGRVTGRLERDVREELRTVRHEVDTLRSLLARKIDAKISGSR